MSKIDPEIANQCRAWPFEEAKAVVARLRALNRGDIKPAAKGYVLFETGYGASGLPHIGTFGEVAPTMRIGILVLRMYSRLSAILRNTAKSANC